MAKRPNACSSKTYYKGKTLANRIPIGHCGSTVTADVLATHIFKIYPRLAPLDRVVTSNYTFQCLVSNWDLFEGNTDYKNSAIVKSCIDERYMDLVAKLQSREHGSMYHHSLDLQNTAQGLIDTMSTDTYTLPKRKGSALLHVFRPYLLFDKWISLRRNQLPGNAGRSSVPKDSNMEFCSRKQAERIALQRAYRMNLRSIEHSSASQETNDPQREVQAQNCTQLIQRSICSRRNARLHTAQYRMDAMAVIVNLFLQGHFSDDEIASQLQQLYSTDVSSGASIEEWESLLWDGVAWLCMALLTSLKETLLFGFSDPPRGGFLIAVAYRQAREPEDAQFVDLDKRLWLYLFDIATFETTHNLAKFIQGLGDLADLKRSEEFIFAVLPDAKEKGPEDSLLPEALISSKRALEAPSEEESSQARKKKRMAEPDPNAIGEDPPEKSHSTQGGSGSSSSARHPLPPRTAAQSDECQDSSETHHGDDGYHASTTPKPNNAVSPVLKTEAHSQPQIKSESPSDGDRKALGVFTNQACLRKKVKNLGKVRQAGPRNAVEGEDGFDNDSGLNTRCYQPRATAPLANSDSQGRSVGRYDLRSAANIIAQAPAGTLAMQATQRKEPKFFANFSDLETVLEEISYDVLDVAIVPNDIGHKSNIDSSKDEGTDTLENSEKKIARSLLEEGVPPHEPKTITISFEGRDFDVKTWYKGDFEQLLFFKDIIEGKTPLREGPLDMVSEVSYDDFIDEECTLESIKGELQSKHLLVTQSPPYITPKAIESRLFMTRQIQVQDLWYRNNNSISNHSLGTLRKMKDIMRKDQDRPMNTARLPSGHLHFDAPRLWDISFRDRVWHFLRSIEHPAYQEIIPVPDDFRWTQYSSRNAYSPPHIDSKGLLTVVAAVDCEELWIIGRPKQESLLDVRAFSKFDPYGCLHDYDWVPLLLKPGDLLYMKPGTVHAALTVTPGFTMGEHFYVDSSMEESLLSMFHLCSRDSFLTNSSHNVAVAKTLFRFLHCWWMSACGRVDEAGVPGIEFTDPRQLRTLVMLGTYVHLRAYVELEHGRGSQEDKNQLGAAMVDYKNLYNYFAQHHEVKNLQSKRFEFPVAEDTKHAEISQEGVDEDRSRRRHIIERVFRNGEMWILAKMTVDLERKTLKKDGQDTKKKFSNLVGRLLETYQLDTQWFGRITDWISKNYEDARMDEWMDWEAVQITQKSISHASPSMHIPGTKTEDAS